MSYNGWKNYETWRVRLEILDGVDPREFFGFDEKPSVEDLASALEEFAEEAVTSGVREGFALYLANDFLSRVDWEEIAEMMIEAEYETAE